MWAALDSLDPQQLSLLSTAVACQAFWLSWARAATASWHLGAIPRPRWVQGKAAVILTLHGPPKHAEIFGNASGDFGMLQVHRNWRIPKTPQFFLVRYHAVPPLKNTHPSQQNAQKPPSHQVGAGSNAAADCIRLLAALIPWLPIAIVGIPASTAAKSAGRWAPRRQGRIPFLHPLINDFHLKLKFMDFSDFSLLC